MDPPKAAQIRRILFLRVLCSLPDSYWATSDADEAKLVSILTGEASSGLITAVSA